MNRLPLCLIIQSFACQSLGHWFLKGLVSFVCLCVPSVQAKVSLRSFTLPQAMTRSVLMDKSAWQGMGFELEHFHSHATPEATLEQLAPLLPELTPVWSEENVIRAHWTTVDTSYALFLWATENQGTEGLLSAIALSRATGLVAASVPMSFSALDWLPKHAVRFFSFVDTSNGLPKVLSSFVIPMITSQLIEHLKSYGQRNGWLRLSEDLSFIRDDKRLTFLLNADKGHTTVLVLESARAAP